MAAAAWPGALAKRISAAVILDADGAAPVSPVEVNPPEFVKSPGRRACPGSHVM